MSIRSFVLGVIVALLALPAAAQEAVGRWNSSVDTANGPFAFVFEFLVGAAGIAMMSKFEGMPPGGGPAEQSFTARRAK
jgi:peptidoglycan/LPS O-acetylase OafA/YrhL